MATDVYYNGVQMHNVVTRQWDEDFEYDPSGTDLIAHDYKLRFEGILHAQQLPDGDPTHARGWVGPVTGSFGSHAAEVYAKIRRLLGQPRKTLLVEMDGKRVLWCCSAQDHPNNAEHDVDNGPKPRNLAITHIAGNSVFRVSFSIECKKIECWGGATYANARAGLVISNRWSVTEEMDETFFTTRSIRGKIRIAHSDVSPMVYKHLTVPLLEDGFRRERVEFAVSEDGLTADYNVSDKQVHTAAPWPSVKIDATHTESTMTGVHFFSEANVKLEGAPDTPKTLLINRAFQVIDSRLGIKGKKWGKDYYIEQAAIIDHIGERNIVEVVIRIRHFMNDPAEWLSLLRCNKVGKPLDLPDVAGQPRAYDPHMNPIPTLHGYIPHKGERGLAAAILFRCYVQTPCDEDHNVNKHVHPTEYTPGDSPGTTTPEVAEYPSPGDITPGEESNYDPSAKTAMYTLARMESKYIIPACRTQMPIAAQTTGSQVNASADASVVFTLARAQCRREITYEAERVGEWPIMPEPKDTYTDGSLKGTKLHHSVSGRASALSPTGAQRVFHLEAYYLYALNRPPRNDESFNIGVLPYTSFAQDENAMTGESVHAERLGP